jgi:hypothetical protein
MIRFFASGLVNGNNLPHAQATSNTLTTVMNTVLGVLGAIVFLMVVVAGLRYITSEGEPEKIAESRRMIIYSLVGLVIVALAATIVNFAVKSS